jgi:hypothetical protein
MRGAGFDEELKLAYRFPKMLVVFTCKFTSTIVVLDELALEPIASDTMQREVTW